MTPHLHSIVCNNAGRLSFFVRFNVSDFEVLDRSSEAYLVVQLDTDRTKLRTSGKPPHYELTYQGKESYEYLKLGSTFAPQGRIRMHYGENRINVKIRHHVMKRFSRFAVEFIHEWLRSVDFDPVLIAFEAHKLSLFKFWQYEILYLHVCRLVQTQDDMDEFDVFYRERMQTLEREVAESRDNFRMIGGYSLRASECFRMLDKLRDMKP